MSRSVLSALLAAALFGASTPFAKLLLAEVSPILLAGLLCLGSGIGLALVRVIRDRAWKPSGLVSAEWPWLLGAIGFGGVLGPVALMFGLSYTSGATVPDAMLVFSVMCIGLLGYGVSLVLFVLALRGLGTARTGAYFSTAPFIGAAVALGLLGEAATPAFWLAAGLMGAGVWLHLTEHHDHEHLHEPLEHAHAHDHDAHHQHPHTFEWDDRLPHEHWHRHLPVAHKHPHRPDIHHRHRH